MFVAQGRAWHLIKRLIDSEQNFQTKQHCLLMGGGWGGWWGLDNYGLCAVSNCHCPLHFLSPNSCCSFCAHPTHQAKVGFKIGAVPWTGAPFTCKYEGNVSEKVVITRLKRGALGFCCVTNAPEEIVIRLIKCSYPADFTPSL